MQQDDGIAFEVGSVAVYGIAFEVESVVVLLTGVRFEVGSVV